MEHKLFIVAITNTFIGASVNERADERIVPNYLVFCYSERSKTQRTNLSRHALLHSRPGAFSIGGDLPSFFLFLTSKIYVLLHAFE